MNLRRPFYEVLSDIFDFSRHRTGSTITLFACSAIALGILVNGLFGVSGALSECLLYGIGQTRASDPGGDLRKATEQMVLPLVFAVIVFVLGYRNYRTNRPAETTLELEPPVPHQGLILLLSPFFNRRGACAFESAEIALQALSTKPIDIVRGEILKSNWGPPLVAVEHHSPVLKCCWILCTEGRDGSACEFETAKKIFQRFTDAKFVPISVNSAHDISSMVPVVEAIYGPGENQNIPPGQIIADFTGATAAMSAGMVLATLDKDRKIEYLRQDRPLDIAGNALTKQQILESRALVTVKTSLALVRSE